MEPMSPRAARRPNELGMLRLLERRARLVEEALADMSERDAAGLAHEQLRAKQRLQSLDLRAQRRLAIFSLAAAGRNAALRPRPRSIGDVEAPWADYEVAPHKVEDLA